MPGRYVGTVAPETPKAFSAGRLIDRNELDSRQEWYPKGCRLGQIITCTQGMIWFTQTGDSKDYILNAGDSLKITSYGPVAIRALESARVSFHAAQKKASLRERLRRTFSPKNDCRTACLHA